MAHSSLFVGSTAIVELDALQDQDGNYQNDATVTLESLTDSVTGNAVSGVTVPVALPYVSSSNGKYQGAIPHDASVTAHRQYVAVIKAVSSEGQEAKWTERLFARVRSA